jgi:hypothetical protein
MYLSGDRVRARSLGYIVKDVLRTITPPTTYDILSPDFDILQAIRTKLNEQPIRTFIAHIKGTPRSHQVVARNKTNVTFMQKLICFLLINKLTIYRKPP